MARVKFIRDEEPNIRSLETNGGVIDGALYVATDTGNMWMGTDKILAGSDNNALLKINQSQKTQTFNLTINSNTAAVTSDMTYNEIKADIENDYRVFARLSLEGNTDNNYCYVEISLVNGGDLCSEIVPFKVLYSDSTAVKTPISVSFYLRCSSSNTWNRVTLPWDSNVGYQTFSNSSFTNTKNNGFYALDIKDKGISTAKLADGAVTKAKLGSDVVIPASKADIGLENVDNTADADKSVKYATSAGSANTASVANSVAWDNVTGAPTIPNTDSFVLHESINEYTAPDNKLNVELISGLDSYISSNPALRATQNQTGTVYSEISAQGPMLGRVYSRPSMGLILGAIESNAIKETNLTDGCVSKSKLGSDVPVIYSSTSEPTSTDGKDGDVWIVYEA